VTNVLRERLRQPSEAALRRLESPGLSSNFAPPWVLRVAITRLKPDRGRIYKLGEGERATESRCNHHAKPAFAG